MVDGMFKRIKTRIFGKLRCGSETKMKECEG
jgi:hypothetical protein